VNRDAHDDEPVPQASQAGWVNTGRAALKSGSQDIAAAYGPDA
jgi:hypothetical protein